MIYIYNYNNIIILLFFIIIVLLVTPRVLVLLAVLSFLKFKLAVCFPIIILLSTL